MELLTNTNYRFMEHRKPAMVLSVALIVVSGAALALRGLNFGIDFTGGTLVELGYEQAADLERIRGTIDGAGFKDAAVQYFGGATDVLIRVAPDETTSQSELSNRLLDSLREAGEKFELLRVDFVGPQVGEELREDGGMAMLFALLGILMYVAFRFEYRFAFGAIIALVHDVVLTVGFFSLFAVEFDLSVLAAILAVIGYSLNDTIVIYDRIREQFIESKRRDSQVIIDRAINNTLSRTVMTGVTTALVLLALLVLGGESVSGFSMAMLVGVVVGTYSSIYVAGSALLFFGVDSKDLIPAEKEGDTVV